MKTFDEVINANIINVSEFETLRQEKQQERKKRSLIGAGVGAGIFILFLIISIVSYNGFFLITGFVISIIVFFIVRGNKRVQFIREFKQNLLKSMISAISSDIEYHPYKHVPREKFKKAQFIKSYSSYNGEDYFVGMYNNIISEFSEITVQQRSDKSTVTVFKGAFYVIEFPRAFAGRTSIVPDNLEKFLGGAGRFFQKLNIFRDNLMKFDNEQFEKEFAIYSSNENETIKVLNPALVQFLLDQKQKYKNVYFGYSETNIYLGLDNRNDLFQVDFNRVIDRDLLSRYYNEMAYHIENIEKIYHLVNNSFENPFA